MIRWLQNLKYRKYARRGFFVFRIGNDWYIRDPLRILFRLNQPETLELLKAVEMQSEAEKIDPEQLERAYRLMAGIFEVPLGPHGASYQELGQLLESFKDWLDAQKKSTNTFFPLS